MNTKIFSAIMTLALATMACGVTIPKQATPGPEVTDNIEVKSPDAKEVNLSLSFGAGKMNLSPGAEQLVEGTATYNYPTLKPEVKTNGADVEINLGDNDFKTFPNFNDIKNEWDFKLGSSPMNLKIDSGAYEGNFDLGGLALTSLSISDGAASVNLSFSDLNPEELSTFRYDTGASRIEMTGLANANFSILDFSGGAGNYTFDFSGDLQRDATITIDAGLSNVHLVIPENVNAVVTVDSGISNVTAGSNWTQSGDTYKQEGEGYTLTFSIEIGAGNLTLTK